MTDKKLPADPIATIGGVLAIVIGVAGCCCYGITAVIPLIIGVVGLVATNRSIRLYYADPTAYHPVSRSNMGMSKILNIIAIVFNGLIVISFIIGVLVFGMATSGALYQGWKNGTFDQDKNWEYEENYEEEGTNYDYEKNEWVEEIQDTSAVDTIIEETVSPRDTLKP